MAAITWRNVDAPSNSDVMRGMQLAQQGVQSGLDKFSSIIKDRETFNQGLADRARTDSQQGYLDMLDGARTPEELAALRMSGALDQRLQSMDPRARAAVRGSEEARLASLRQQFTANNTYNEAVTNEADKPALARANAAIARDDIAGARTEAEKLSPEKQTQIYNAARIREAAIPGEKQVAALAKISNPAALATARFNADTLPDQQALKRAQTASEMRTVEDANHDRALSQILANDQQTYLQSITQGRAALGEIALKLKLPVDPATGAPIVTGMDKAQRTQLDAAAVAAGLPGVNDLFTGDTAFANKRYEGLLSSGRFPTEFVARNQDRILKTFNSTSLGALVGNDDALRRLNQATEDVTQAERDSNNRYAPNTPNALKNYEELGKEVATMFKGTDMAEDQPAMDALLHKAATVGIEVKPGKFITPSKLDMLAAVRSQMGNNNIFNKSRAKQVEAYLKDQLSTANVDQLLLDSETSKMNNRARAIREILTPKK